MQIRDYLSSNVIICILYFNYFREVGQKYTYIFFCFLVQMKTSKSHSEINRPLVVAHSERKAKMAFVCNNADNT